MILQQNQYRTKYCHQFIYAYNFRMLLLSLWKYCTRFLILALQCDIIRASRILILPYPVTSHALYLSSIGDELVRRGHEGYIMLSPDMPSPPKIENSLSKKLYYKVKYSEDNALTVEEERALLERFIEEEPDTAQHWVWEDPDMSLLCLGRSIAIFRKLS